MLVQTAIASATSTASNVLNTDNPQPEDVSQDLQQQIETLMAEKEEHQQELDENSATIKKQEALVLSLNKEIMRQDTAVLGLQTQVKKKDDALQKTDSHNDTMSRDLLCKNTRLLLLEKEAKQKDEHIAVLKSKLYKELEKRQELEQKVNKLRTEKKEKRKLFLRNMVTSAIKHLRGGQKTAILDLQAQLRNKDARILELERERIEISVECSRPRPEHTHMSFRFRRIPDDSTVERR